MKPPTSPQISPTVLARQNMLKPFHVHIGLHRMIFPSRALQGRVENINLGNPSPNGAIFDPPPPKRDYKMPVKMKVSQQKSAKFGAYSVVFFPLVSLVLSILAPFGEGWPLFYESTWVRQTKLLSRCVPRPATAGTSHRPPDPKQFKVAQKR